ncbi:MAG: ATP-binding protein [Armatimonadota bacterium]
MSDNHINDNTEFEVSSEQSQVDFHFKATAEAAAQARRQFRHILDNWCPNCSATRDELLLAVGEAISNACRHGCGGKPLPIHVSASWDAKDREVTVEVHDPGSGFDYPLFMRRTHADEDYSCGLFLMVNSADSVSYERRDNSFVCTIKKRL